MAQPIIFLDVDGVLNHRGVFVPRSGPDPICKIAAKRFVELVANTGARVVLSSTWRLHPEPVAKLRRLGIMKQAHEDWRTIDLPNRVENGFIVDVQRRGQEIAEWLSRHPDITDYVIIDDDSDMLPEQMPRFVQTSFDTGLLDEHCERARAILEGR